MSEINFSDYVYYDETSPSCLRWKVDRCAGKDGKGRIMVHAGSKAGCLMSIGYYNIKIAGKFYYAHRIIWQILKGDIPEDYEIDHLDGNRSDNRITNLECKLRKFNLRNQSKRVTNKSGVSGVYLSIRRGFPYWVACWWTLDKIRKNKTFSCNKLGHEEAFKQACEYRQKMLSELNAQGAGYSERHCAN